MPPTLHPFHPIEEGSLYQAEKGAALEDPEQLELTLEVSSLSALSTGHCPGTGQEGSLLILASQPKSAHENRFQNKPQGFSSSLLSDVATASVNVSLASRTRWKHNEAWGGSGLDLVQICF